METGPNDRPLRKARVPKVKPRVVKPPKGDVSSSGGDYGMRQARRAETSAPVKRAQQAVYSAQPVARRRQILANATGSVAANVKPVHVRAIKRNEQIAHDRAQHDITTDADRARAAQYLLAHPEVMHPDHPHHGSLLGTITGAAKIGQAGAKAASDLAGKAAPYAYAVASPVTALPIALAGGPVKRIGSKILSNAARDVVDIPANAVPSMYKIAETAVHDPGKAAGMLAQPYEDLYHHPGKSFTEHPVGTALLVSGAKGGAGRGVGKALRVAPSKTLRRVGSTERAPIAGPGNMAAEQAHPYSKDVINKGARVAYDRLKARRQPGTPARTMNEQQIQRRVDENVAAGRVVAGQHEAQTAKAAKKAVGRKPTAAVSLVAQGITNASPKDIGAYLAHLETEAKQLTGGDLALNQQTQAAIRRALKHHNEPRAQQAAQRYSDLAAGLEQQVLARNLVSPDVAEVTRLTGAAVRKLGAQTGTEPRRAVRAQAKDTRVLTAKQVKAARKALTQVEQEHAQALANARVSVAGRNTSAALKQAERQHRTALAEAARAKRAHDQAKTAVGVAQGRSQILSRNVGGQAGGRGVQLATDALHSTGEHVKVTRAAVRTAERAVAVQRSRVRGVAPAQADALLRSIAERDAARAALTTRRTVAKGARAQHVTVKTQLKAGALPGPHGEMLDAATIRAQLGGLPVEPAYVSHAPGGDVHPAAVPTEPPKLAHDTVRAGEAVNRGTLDLSPDRLVAQSVDTQRRIDSADNYTRFLDEFAHRESKGGAHRTFGTREIAGNAARNLQDDTGVAWLPMRTLDKQWVLVPKAAARRLAEHAAHTQTPGRAFTQAWSRNVLAFSPKWLAGQTVEPGFRAAVAHAGPRSYVTARRVLAQMDTGSREQLKARTIGTGLTNTALRKEALDPATTGRYVRTIMKVSRRHGPREVIAAYNALTNLTLGTINHLVQSPSQTAMLGKAIRDSPLMGDHVVKLSRQAIADAAHGLSETNAQVALGRAVDDMAGRYGKFDPTRKAILASYSPFAAWLWASLKFLTIVLPRDHPVLTSLIVSANQATEGWRRDHGLVFDPIHAYEGMAPGWQQGSIPGKGGSHLILGRYLPFGLADDEGFVLGGVASSILPQYMGAIRAITEGEDWTGQPLAGRGNSAPVGQRYLAALSTIVKGVLPAANQISALAGVKTPDMPKGKKIKPTVGARVRALNDPFMYLQSHTPGQADVGTVISPTTTTTTPTRRLPPLPRPPARNRPRLPKIRVP